MTGRSGDHERPVSRERSLVEVLEFAEQVANIELGAEEEPEVVLGVVDAVTIA